jgi:2-oxoglutarate dehydrogenase E2 component (dihydrolipoamide succinyltransferase)
MDIVEVKVPFLGEGIERVCVSCWHKKEGDRIAAQEDIVEVEADKAIFNIPCECEGVLKQILVPGGEEARVGQSLATVEKK